MAELNDQIKAWLADQGKIAAPGDYRTGHADGEPDGIIAWDTGKLGSRPTSDQLAATLPALEKAELKQHAAAARYRMEIAGITVTVGAETGIPVSTQRGNDREVLTATMLAISAGLRSDTATFKFEDDKSRVVSNADMQALIVAAFAHVQTAFDIETTAQADIDSGALTAVADIDARFA